MQAEGRRTFLRPLFLLQRTVHASCFRPRTLTRARHRRRSTFIIVIVIEAIPPTILDRMPQSSDHPRGDHAHPYLLIRSEGLVERLPCVRQPFQPGGALLQRVGPCTDQCKRIGVTALLGQSVQGGQAPVARFGPRTDRLLDGRPVLLLLRS